MTDGDGRAHRSAGAVEVRVAARLENLAVLRTLIGAVGTFEDLDFDAVADLRLAVDEACTRLIRSAAAAATLAPVAAQHCAQDCIQVHGGIGFTWEHDAHLFFRRARATAAIGGTPAQHRDRAVEAGCLDLLVGAP